MFTKLNMNDNNGKIRLDMKETFYLQHSFSEIILHSTFSQTKDLFSVYLRSVKIFRKYITKELMVRASFIFLSEVGIRLN